jgi:hypothetical protein
MAFRLYPRKPGRRQKRPASPDAAPVSTPAVTAAEYRARIAIKALSGFRPGDDLVSIGLDTDGAASSGRTAGALLSGHSPPKRGAE